MLLSLSLSEKLWRRNVVAYIWSPSEHRAAEVGGESEICLHVCCSVCLSFSGSIDRRMSCLKWSWHASEAADVMCHPFVTSALSNPSQKALPLWIWWSPAAICATCTCVCLRRILCADALTNLLNHSYPPPHWWLWRCRGRERGPWKTPVLRLNPAALNATVPQPSWHLPWDTLNELKEIQWDTWCSSHGTPLLLCLSAQFCLSVQAWRRAHHETKNTQSATVYQADLSSPPPQPPTHPPTSPCKCLTFPSLAVYLLTSVWLWRW